MVQMLKGSTSKIIRSEFIELEELGDVKGQRTVEVKIPQWHIFVQVLAIGSLSGHNKQEARHTH